MCALASPGEHFSSADLQAQLPETDFISWGEACIFFFLNNFYYNRRHILFSSSSSLTRPPIDASASQNGRNSSGDDVMWCH